MSEGHIDVDLCYLRKNPVDERIFSAFVEHLGNVIYNGIYNPSQVTSNEDGFRTDVIDLVKELNISRIRYPGGNFACSYNWEDTVGPLAERPVRSDLAWTQTEPNIVGLAEFEKWVNAIGSKLLLTVNASTRGAMDAANEVEYCNREKGTWYSDLRRRHGHANPYDIKDWCIGNEVDGPWNIGMKKADIYGWDAKEIAKAMRRIDPNIQLVAVGSSGTQLDTYLTWDRTVLENVYNYVDMLSLHRYLGMDGIEDPTTYDKYDPRDYLELSARFERNIKDVIAACDYVKGVQHSNKTMYISIDEYNTVDVPSVNNETSRQNEIREPWQIGPASHTPGMSLEATLLYGLAMITILRHSDRVHIACQSILVNGGGLVMCEQNDDAWVNGTYYIFKDCSRYGRGKIVDQKSYATEYPTKSFGTACGIDSVCVWHESERELDVLAVNKTAERMNFSLNAVNFHDLKPINHLVLTAPKLTSRNSLECPDTLKPVTIHDIACTGSAIKCEFAPYSWNVLRLQA